MDSITSLGKRFEAKLAEHKTLLAKGEEFTVEDAEKAEALVGEMAAIREQIESLQKVSAQAAELEAWASASAGAPPLRTTPGTPGVAAGAGQFGNGVTVLGIQPAGEMILNPTKQGLEVLNFDRDGQPDRAFKSGAFRAAASDAYAAAYVRAMQIGWGRLTGSEQALLQEGVDTDGGFLAPEQILSRVIQRQPTPTRIAGRVTRITTSRDALSVPKVNYSTDDLYTTGIRVAWTGEVPESSTAHRVTRPQFGQIRIPVYTAMMSLPVTNDLLEDAIIDLMAWLSGKFAETVDLVRDDMILNGTGVGQPMGILANPGGTNQPATVVTGHASQLTGDGLINLTEALPEQYDENSILVFNKTNTGRQIRLLKDADGRPLVTYGNMDNGLGSGRYRQVNGYDFIWSGFAPNVAANSHPIVFGDLVGYYLVDRLGMSMQILREVEAQNNQVIILARVRFGGVTAEEWRLRVQKVAAA